MADYTSTGIIHNTSVDFTRRVISEPVHVVQGGQDNTSDFRGTAC